MTTPFSSHDATMTAGSGLAIGTLEAAPSSPRREDSATSVGVGTYLHLLRIAECTSAKSNQSIRGLVEMLVPQLSHALGCSWLGFFGVQGFVTSSDYAIGERYELIEWGARSLSDDDLIHLVGQHADRAIDEPFLGRAVDRGGMADVEVFVLARVYHQHQHWGWLVALQTPWGSLSAYSAHTADDLLPPCARDDDPLSLVRVTCQLIATQASNIQMLAQRDDMMVNMVRTLVSAIEAKDAFVRGHSERVAMFSRMLADELRLGTADGNRIYLAALLHDIGKIGVPDATLQNSGELTPEEFAQVKRHPEAGWQILRTLTPLHDILPGVLHHHERVDGQGYPDGLEGDAIPLDARILAVADAYDAMTSDRAYRSGLSQERAEQILRSGSGAQWDARVVDALFRIMPQIITTRQSYRFNLPKSPRRRTMVADARPT